MKQAPVDQYQGAGTPKKNGKINKKTVAVKTVTYSGLTAGMHTILIVATGTANSPSSGTVVTSDVFTVDTVVSED